MDKRSAVTANLCYRATLEAIEGAEAVDAVRVHCRARCVRVRALAAGAAQGGGDRAARAREQAAAAPGGGGDRRRERHRPGGGTAVRGGGRARRGRRPRRRDRRQVATELARTAGPSDRRRGRRARRCQPRCPVPSRRCSSSAASIACSTPPAYRRASRRSRTSGARTFSGSSTCTTSAPSRRSAGPPHHETAGHRWLDRGSVSKAAVVPGKEAVAYAGSKAALLQALRVAAVELGRDGIRVNAINADQVDTPLFAGSCASGRPPRGHGSRAAGSVPAAEPHGCGAHPRGGRGGPCGRAGG